MVTDIFIDLLLQRTDEDVQSHLRAAEDLSEAEGSYKAAIRVITDELQIAYQRFKTLLADYEVLLSMSATFYTSVEKVSFFYRVHTGHGKP